MNKLKIMTLMTLLISFSASPTLAQRHGWADPSVENERPAQRFERLQQQLDLTPEQSAEIQAIFTRREAARLKQRAQARATRQEVDNLMSAEPVNERRLRELMHEQADLRADRLLSRQTARSAVDQVLTPAQQEKHHAMQQQRLEHHRPQRGAESQGRRRL